MLTESDFDPKNVWKLFWADKAVLPLSIVIFLISFIAAMERYEWTLKQMVGDICIHFFKLSFSRFILGLIISLAFASGGATVIVALQHKQGLASKLQKLYEYAGIIPEVVVKTIDCNVCGIIKCNRHLSTTNREPWRGLFITKELDDALASVSFDLKSI